MYKLVLVLGYFRRLGGGPGGGGGSEIGVCVDVCTDGREGEYGCGYEGTGIK